MAQGNQLGIGSSSVLPDHGHVAAGDGGPLNPETALNPQPKVDFGRGDDGDVVIAVGANLSRDMAYNNLTVNAGIGLSFFGYRIKVKGKLTLEAGSWVESVGNNGVVAAGAVGGAGGNGAFATRRPGVCLPTSGGAGADAAGGAGLNVSAGGVAPDVDLVAVTLLHEGRLWAGGGGGGGGAVSAAPGLGANPARVLAGAKGGDGALAHRHALNHEKAGGGGGGGGGLIEIWANEFDNNGSVIASGGNGGSGVEDANAHGGGGGGGGGGAILIFYKTLSGGGLGVRTVSGGAGGGTLAPGAAGAAGYSYAMKIGA